MQRKIFDEDHESFRKTIRQFIEAEVVPLRSGMPRAWCATYAKARRARRVQHRGARGVRRAGLETFKYEAVMAEETARAGVTFGGSGVRAALPALHQDARDAGAEGTLAAEVRDRRGDVGHRHDRARHRVQTWPG